MTDPEANQTDRYSPERQTELELRRVQSDDESIRRFVAECWFPYQEELSGTVSEHSLVDELETADVVEHFEEELDSPKSRIWVALTDKRHQQ